MQELQLITGPWIDAERFGEDVVLLPSFGKCTLVPTLQFIGKDG